ncbi:hypothetical protein ON010_g14391 [Phytophthora cinnamomi]|nr:hypothetical protein ON010_g14391 [Phytophthora cinnamomi]
MGLKGFARDLNICPGVVTMKMTANKEKIAVMRVKRSIGDAHNGISRNNLEVHRHLGDTAQAAQIEEKAMSNFGLWGKAAKSKRMPDAIIFSGSSAEETKSSHSRSSSSSKVQPVETKRNPSSDFINIPSASEMVSQLHRTHPHLAALSALDIPKSMSLTRSTSPRIGRPGFSSLPDTSLRRAAAVQNNQQAEADEEAEAKAHSTIEIINPITQWKRGELIGEGTFGRVYKGLNISTGELFALKEIEIHSSPNADQVTQMQKLGEEIALMNNLNHKHIVRYKGSHRSANHFYIFMEYVPGGSIASMLKQFDAFSEDLIRLYTRQIVQGVMYLHQMGIVHRDIKGANVLVTDQGVSKLADFGCSKQIPQMLTTSLEESLRSIRGSIPWMAPEVVKQTGHGYEADIWSIGATVIEMATAKHPWPHCHNGLAAMYTIAMATAPPPLPEHLSPEAKSFLRRCFCIDPGATDHELQTWTSNRFELQTEVYGAGESAQGTGKAQQTWILYFDKVRTLQLQFANEKDYRPYNWRGELTTPTNIRLVDTDFYSGAARLAIVPQGAPQAAVDALDKAAAIYPVGSSITTDVGSVNASYSFCWKTKRFLDLGEPNLKSTSTAELLMLANPHHAATLKPDSDVFQVLGQFGHRTLKSNMTAVLGSCWEMQETLPTASFQEENVQIQPQYLEAIKVALANDSNYTPEAEDPYYFGKEIGRQARLVLIADKLDEKEIRDEILDKLEEWLTPWMLGQNGDHFVYDRSWGGLCSLNGLKGVFWMTDFGNGWYNDHHFHYGYFLYAVAVVGKFRPDFVKTHRTAVMSIVRDIASPDQSDGVYTLDGGKSQESVSEAINAYYGVYLVGKSFKVPEVERMGHLLLAMEIRGALTYWQMPSSSGIYEPIYAANKMTGQVAATKVSYTTWFGPQVEHIHLINMIPFTPITDAFLKPAYVQEEYPILQQQAFDRAENPIDDRWKGYAYLDLAIIDPTTAWTKVQNMSFFDDGSSRANSLYWIATRLTN